MELPPPELGSLPAIAAALSEVSLFRRERVAAQMLRQSYLTKLLDAFRVGTRAGRLTAWSRAGLRGRGWVKGSWCSRQQA